jgi:hypothetical protein
VKSKTKLTQISRSRKQHNALNAPIKNLEGKANDPDERRCCAYCFCHDSVGPVFGAKFKGTAGVSGRDYKAWLRVSPPVRDENVNNHCHSTLFIASTATALSPRQGI